MIVLVRCDDRLIHGQCMTVITKVNNIDNIIVVDDFTATNAILKRVFRTAVPSNMHANVYTVKESAPVIEKAMADNSKTLVLMKNPKVYVQLLDEVQNFPKHLNVGPMSSRKGTKPVNPAINIMPDEAEAIKTAVSRGAHVYFQQVPEQRLIEWDEVKHLF